MIDLDISILNVQKRNYLFAEIPCSNKFRRRKIRTIKGKKMRKGCVNSAADCFARKIYHFFVRRLHKFDISHIKCTCYNLINGNKKMKVLKIKFSEFRHCMYLLELIYIKKCGVF